MKTKIDEIYLDIKIRLKYNLKFTENILENISILNKQVEITNIAKCDLSDIEKEYPGGTTYLMYLLQSEQNINFGLCQNFKIWYNRQGCQTRCKKALQSRVYCEGLIKKCSLNQSQIT